MEYVWIEKGKDINNIVDDMMKLHIKWSKKPDQDYEKLSRYYFNAGYMTLTEVVEGSHNNKKSDMWFLPGVYMMRQAIELLIKAGIAINVANKSELQQIFLTGKHNLSILYEFFKDNNSVENLTGNEQTWLEKYLDSIELVDSNSDLFRYPFKDDFLKQYEDQALDIYHMGNRLIYCYSTLNKLVYGEWFEEIELNFKEEARFIKLANSAVNNCYLWESPWSNGFHKQVIGYSEVATFLFERFKESKDEALFYPIVFSMRNAIEIGLKRLLHMQMDQKIDEHVIRKKRNSHLLYKDLWKSIKPMLSHYSDADNQDNETLETAESYICSLDSLDKKGDIFRYPGTYSHEYKFNDKEIDVENFYNYLLGLFHFIEGCDAWLDNIRDYEMEIRSEYLNDIY